MKIAVLGGGITGLACAHYLQKAGYQPIVLEATGRFGALGQRQLHAGIEFDCFHTPLSQGDTALLGLMGDLGLHSRALWRPIENAVSKDGNTYPLSSARSLLRFEALPLGKRAHAAAVTLGAQRVHRYDLRLDREPACEWLVATYGEQTYESLWRPMLMAQFGADTPQIPAYLAWRFINHFMSGQHAVRGYIDGGFQLLGHTLAQKIRAGGGEVRIDEPVLGIECEPHRVVLELGGRTETFDAAISTLAPPELAKFAQGQILAELPYCEESYLGLISVAVVGGVPRQQHYRTICLDETNTFPTVIDTSHLDGERTFYLEQRCGSHTPAYRLGDDVIEKQAIETLRRVSPSFDARTVEGIYISRAPNVEPIWSVGSLATKAPVRVGDLPVFFCNTAQAYPRAPGSDTSVMLAREAVACLRRELLH